MPPYSGELLLTPEEIDALFMDDEQTTPAAENDTASEQTTPVASDEQKSIETDDTTKAFSKRLAKMTTKAVADERERIAKDLGFDSYDSMMQSKERKVIEDNGLDPEASSKAIDEIVKMRIDADPRMQELEELRAQRLKEFANKELKEITSLTNGEITSLTQLPKPVIELWKKTGSLKNAYMQLEGEKLLKKARAGQVASSTDHLRSMGTNGTQIDQGKRLLTPEEKSVWKLFNPQMTDDELNKITVNK